MSRVKITNSELSSILKRVKSRRNLKTDKDIADLLNISTSDFSNRKKRGTLLPLITQWAIHENVNIDQLIKGNEDKTPVNSCVREKDASYRDGSSVSVDDLLDFMRSALTGGNEMFTDLFKENILYHVHILNMEKRLARLEKEFNSIKERSSKK
jgi:hypothetical protein